MAHATGKEWFAAFLIHYLKRALHSKFKASCQTFSKQEAVAVSNPVTDIGAYNVDVNLPICFAVSSIRFYLIVNAITE